jgi:polyhydroxybutyrate depolymerase
MTRTYALQIPTGYDGSKPVALVFDYHGFNSNATVQAGHSGWRDKGNEKGFIVVEPQGVANAWNGGSCCARATADDVAFTKAIATQIAKEFCVDPKRIYATGLANGGAMAHRLACEASDFIAASAPVSMGGLTTCAPSRPITIVEFRGRNDVTVPYNGGLFRGAEADFAAWAKVNGCTGEPSANSPPLEGLANPSEGCRTYEQCKDGVTVTLCSPAAPNVLYSAAAPAAKVADIAWPIFEDHPMP